MDRLSYTGRYWLSDQDGSYLCLEIYPPMDGHISGSLTGRGMASGLTAIIKGKKLVGKFSSGNFTAVYFKVHRTFYGLEMILLGRRGNTPQRFPLIRDGQVGAPRSH